MASTNWQRFKDYYCAPKGLGLALDISRMDFPADFFDSMKAKMEKAYSDMEALEGGAIANPDEKRQVGHYWLRNAAIAPDQERRQEVMSTLETVKKVAADVHSGAIKPPNADRFLNVLVIGIGGSALGPQFVKEALGGNDDAMAVFFLDNTDPDGMDVVLQGLEPVLGETLAVVISKSGGTKETRNGMLEAKAAYEEVGLDFAAHAIAITGIGSNLDKVAEADGWLRRVPMFDYVGGRTSEFSAVGMLPAALEGFDIDGLLAGAAAMDECTRNRNTPQNPAALMALMWYYATNGKGERDLVILPYKDRLCLFSKYLQQLIMESLGKEKDLDGNVVHQGLSVYGNKGSTDQHAYVQQLRDGVNNFFVTFIEVLKDREGASMEVEPGVTSGDYLHGFFQGTRTALAGSGRESMTITVEDVSPRTVGMLIALFERAVGFYATLVNINAYHQPGVEAGKKAAAALLELQGQLVETMKANAGITLSAEGWAEKLSAADKAEEIYLLLEHLAANGRGITQSGPASPADAQFACS
ncbi:glucose-6-phosphate isomerase [bacterium]|nr:glucose-6-phosphate isomerase [bacterium]